MELGGLLVERGNPGEAEELLRHSLAIYREATPDTARIARAQTFLGASLIALGRFAEAEPLLLAGRAALVAERGAAHRWTSDAERNLVALYDTWGRPAEAERYRGERGR